jgi:hypothetical protein
MAAQAPNGRKAPTVQLLAQAAVVAALAPALLVVLAVCMVVEALAPQAVKALSF